MSPTEIIYCCIMVAAITLVLVNEYYSFKLKVVPGPSMPWARKAMIDALKKHAKTTPCRIMEPGSGWGGVARSCAKEFPDSQVDGYEISPFPYIFSRILPFFLPQKNLKFYRKDFTKVNWKNYDVVLCYLTWQLMAELSPLWQEQLPKGALIISNAQPLKEWEEIDVIKTSIGTVKTPPIYVYRKK